MGTILILWLRSITIGRVFGAFAALALGVALPACGSSEPGTDGSRIDVVASFYPLAEAASRVGGASVRVDDLTPPGVEPHDLELTPDDLERISTADVVVYLGGGFQPAVEDAVAQAEDAIVVDVLHGLDTRPAPPDEANEGVAVDPHVWLDPRRFAEIVDQVVGALVGADPAMEEAYRTNGETFRDELDQLDDAFRAGLSSCERRTIVTSHDAFGYLAEAYGLTQLPITGLSPEAEPDARRLAELRDLVASEGITTIFAEELVSPDVAETLADEAGVTVDLLNPIESLTDEQSDLGKDYDALMRQNLEALERALDC
jgi:zinc transport system substrate-binding protein